jgi:hypothetical protein
MIAKIHSLEQLVKPYLPSPLLDAARRLKHRSEAKKRAKFERFRGSVSTTINAIHNLTAQQCADRIFLEQTFIPSLGLNDEFLNEQPPELSSYFGTGLHIWQYPNQLAAYLCWLSDNSKGVRCYMEIGCRWGGMFLLVSEWLRKNGADLDTVIALDLIKPTPFIDEYFKYLQNENIPGRKGIEAIYICDTSNSREVSGLVERVKPDFVFIDGDHALKGVLLDHLLVRDCAQIIVHHDVNSHSCPDTALLWNAVKKLERHDFDFFEFIDQYDSVNGSFLGIGAMKRRAFERA